MIFLLRSILSLFRLLLTAIGGWLLYSAVFIKHQVHLPPAIDANREEFHGHHSTFLSFYADAQASGRPLVLIHSINAAGSSYEMRPLFEHFRGKRPVYALDLPGFGFSDRSDREYTPGLYKQAILDFLSRFDEPVDLIALSLGCEFAALALMEQPEKVASLTLISPTGFTESPNKTRGQRTSESKQAINTTYQIVSNPIWSQGLFDLLVSKPSLRLFLNMSFYGDVDQGLLDYAWLTSHQPGARYAPLAFISGKLFTTDIRQRAYDKLPMQTLILYDKDSFVRFDTLPDALKVNPNLRARRIPQTKGLPHFERLDKVIETITAFWDEVS